MKLSIAAIILLFTAAICSYALAEKDVSRPVGIPAGQWIPLSDRAGIVISDYQPGDETKTSQGLIRPERVQRLPPPGQAALLARQRSAQDAAVLERQRSLENSARGYINGYFMLKQNGRWIRLSVVPPPQLLGSVKPNGRGGGT
jgi:hypothetical protein